MHKVFFFRFSILLFFFFFYKGHICGNFSGNEDKPTPAASTVARDLPADQPQQAEPRTRSPQVTKEGFCGSSQPRSNGLWQDCNNVAVDAQVRVCAREAALSLASSDSSLLESRCLAPRPQPRLWRHFITLLHLHTVCPRDEQGF